MGLLLIGLFCVLLTPQPAAADISQSSTAGCSVTINGQSADRPLTTDNAIAVKEHTDVSVTMQMSSPVHRRQISLSFGVGPSALVSDETDPTGPTTTVSVDKYATYGVGLYSIRAVASSERGDTCTIGALIRVEGNPLATVAGGSAAGLEALSLLGIGAAALGGANPGEAGTGVDTTADPADDPTDSEGFPKDPMTAANPEQFVYRAEAGLSMFGFCALAALPALLLTSAAMVGGAAPTGAPIRLARVHWRPRFSIVGMISGLLGAVAGVVLLQQTGQLFPSYEIFGRALVAGLLAGILIPSLTRLIAARRANRRVAAREAAINAAVSRSAAPTAIPGKVAAPAWVATHRAGAASVPVRPQPEAALEPSSAFSPGTALCIVEERGNWARVQAADGREGWVEQSHIERMT